MATMDFPPEHNNCRCSISVSYDNGKTWESLGDNIKGYIIDGTQNPLWDELRTIIEDDEKKRAQA